MNEGNFRLSNGLSIPCVGYGTCGVDSQEAVEAALSAGYRLIDTASHYFNEMIVGEAVRIYGKREEIFITTKLWYSDMGYDNAIKAFEVSLKKLNVAYVDLFLIHWPAESVRYPDWKRTNKETWRALEDLYYDNKARSIGVCNFMEKHMSVLLGQCREAPMVNQIENHPGLYRSNAVRFCQNEGIHMEAWEPLGGGKILNNKCIMSVAEKYGKTPAQICLRWNLQHGFSVIPKSSKRSRMEENRDIFDFKISETDMQILDALPFCGGQGAIVK